MTQGRKISDDEAVKISGGGDNSDADWDTITESGAPAVTPGREDHTPPGGSPDLETEGSGGGNSGAGASMAARSGSSPRIEPTWIRISSLLACWSPAVAV